MLYQLGFKILALQTFSFTFMCNVEQQIKKPQISDYIYIYVKLELSSFSLASVVFQNYPDHDIPVKKTNVVPCAREHLVQQNAYSLPVFAMLYGKAREEFRLSNMVNQI